jgi:hypothetical protein
VSSPSYDPTETMPKVCGTCEFWSYGPQNTMLLPARSGLGLCRLVQKPPHPDTPVQTLSMLVTSGGYGCRSWELD